MDEPFDVAVIGAGAAGMMCAAVAGQRGRSVVLLDHSAKLAEKIRISGGGRCNFTNRAVGCDNFVSANPRFARSALERYSAQDFIALVTRHRIGFHEKHRGQLFCDESSDRIIAMLVAECDAGRVEWRRPVRIVDCVPGRADGRAAFRIDTDAGTIEAVRVVVATGGLAIPKIGATDFAYRLAKRFGLRIVEPRPALVPLTFARDAWAPFAALSGVALEVEVRCDADRSARFREDLLFTHRGLSGPAALQISSYWRPGSSIEIDLVPDVDLATDLLTGKDHAKHLSQALASHLPKRLATGWRDAHGIDDRRLAESPNATLKAVADGLEHWRPTPDGTEGFQKAEVTAGGIDTAELSQQTLEAKRVPGLHFIGEAVDITGWLGGYNFQWAWSSGYVAGRAV